MERTCKEACNISPAGLMTPRDAAVYIGVKINTLAVCQIGKSRPIPQSRFGRMDQQKRINRQGGVIRPVLVIFYFSIKRRYGRGV